MTNLCAAFVLLLQIAQPGATLRGAVLDRDGGSPLAGVIVQVQGTGLTAVTDARGRFEILGVPSGRRTLYVSLIGFILVKRTVQVDAGGALDVTIALAEGTGTYSEDVTVRAARFPEQEPSVASQQTLGSADILNLRNLLTNDPMRAIQVLPGVTTGDDFRSEFAVRGSGFSHMVFTFDGIPTTFLLHTVQQVRDGGSIAMVNGDVLSGITLLNGSYPQRYGNRLGAELDFVMREGSRERTQTRVSVSGTDASIVAEGPIGARKAGSWLVSARKSYLDFLLRKITDEDDFGFSFADTQAKAAYDVAPAHRIDLTVVAGRSTLDQSGLSTGRNFLEFGRNTAWLASAAWRFTPSPSFVMTQRLAYARQTYRNTNPTGIALGEGGGRDLTWRADVTSGYRSLQLEAGVQIQGQRRDEHRVRVLSATSRAVIEEYDRGATLSGLYFQVRRAGTRASGSAGLRVDHWSITGDAAVSPWVLGDVRLGRGMKLRAGAGVHSQFPPFEASVGQQTVRFPDLLVTPERAYHADIGIEGSVGASARWQVTVYNREERDASRRRGAEARAHQGAFQGGSSNAPWVTSLDGYARGAELLLQRRAASGLSGWLSYSYGVNRYDDRVTGESFDGDFDQRHTFNAYGMYRLTSRMNVAARLRSGSNVPAPGYWEERNGEYFLSDRRNLLRVPPYARLDLRGSRTYNFKSKRLTLFVEIINALDRENARFVSPDIDVRTFRASGLFESMLPRLPSAGILIEF
ncbi:MAG: TonB-dependent receptor [Acidobacteriota bacterium]|nr:TonB-dependent receptor [Acidobacteriota bacterium]